MAYEEAQKVIPAYKQALLGKLCVVGGQVKITYFHSDNPGQQEVELRDLNELESEFYHGGPKVTFVVRFEDREITRFSLVEFPGCCAILVSTGAKVNPDYRNRGINRLTNEFRQDIAKFCGYSALICTDVAQNYPQRRVLAHNSFKDIYSLKNSRTGNLVHVSIKEL